MNSSSKKKFYITLAAGIVFVFALIFIARFFLQIVQNSYAELISLYDSKETFQQANQYLAEVSKEAAVAAEKQQEINKNFIEKGKEVDFIIKLEETAEKTSNMIEITTGELPKDKQTENILVFNIHLAGTFPNLMQFLDEMNSLAYFTDVISLNVQRIEKTIAIGEGGAIMQDNIEGNVKTSMIIKTYFK